MSRSFLNLTLSAAMMLPLADTVAADHNRARGNGFLGLDIGQGQFRSGMSGIRIEFGRRAGLVARSNVPFLSSDNDQVYFNAPRNRSRSEQLDEDLGRALEELRRDLALRNGVQPAPPQNNVAPTRPRGEIEVTRLPDLGTQPVVIPPHKPGQIIEEEAILGRIPLLSETAPVPATRPATTVSTASAGDVETYGPTAFAPLTQPEALGLPALAGGAQYFVLNGKVVTLDAEAHRALTMSALNQVLAQ